VTRDLELLVAAMRAYDAVMRRHTCPDCGAAWEGDSTECWWCAETERRLVDDQREALLWPTWMADQGVRYHELDRVDQKIWCDTRGIPRGTGPLEFWAARLRRAVSSGLVTMLEADMALARYDHWQRRRGYAAA
jgi:hypothetical protein